MAGSTEFQEAQDGFSTIQMAVEAFGTGKMIIVVDDEDRENEGDMVMAASMVTPESIKFMLDHGSGVICVPMKGDRLDALRIPLMVRQEDNDESHSTAFTVTVDAFRDTTTGISEHDRAVTIRALAHPDSVASDFRKPGHVFPLRYREGGVLKRAGHTEATVDLAVMAGLESPVGVICEVRSKEDPRAMAKLPELRKFAQRHGLLMISIADLVRQRKQTEPRVERFSSSRIPTKWGLFLVHIYKSKLDNVEHLALVKGEVGDGSDVLVRVHSECVTGDIFASKRCDCGSQLDKAMAEIEREGRGVLVYLKGHEGRGIGLGHKLRAYNLQDQGRDTVDANIDLGLPVDSRDYGVGAQILLDLGVKTMVLMTNNPVKYTELTAYGLGISRRKALLGEVTDENRRYLETKHTKLGHLLNGE